MVLFGREERKSGGPVPSSLFWNKMIGIWSDSKLLFRYQAKHPPLFNVGKYQAWFTSKWRLFEMKFGVILQITSEFQVFLRIWNTIVRSSQPRSWHGKRYLTISGWSGTDHPASSMGIHTISGVSVFGGGSRAVSVRHCESRASSHSPKCLRIFWIIGPSVMNEITRICWAQSGQINGSSFQIFFMHSHQVRGGTFLGWYFETSMILTPSLLFSSAVSWVCSICSAFARNKGLLSRRLSNHRRHGPGRWWRIFLHCGPFRRYGCIRRSQYLSCPNRRSAAWTSGDIRCLGYWGSRSGLGGKLVAYVVLQDGFDMSETDIIDYIGSRIADYKKPKELYIINEIPYSPSGKQLKRVLRTRYTNERQVVSA